MRNTATSCKATVTFKSMSDSKTLDVPGRWSATPEPLSWFPTGAGTYQDYDLAKVPQTLRFDLPPDPDGEVVGIAIKLDGESEAYAFTSESYEDPHQFHVPRFKLPDKEYAVSVVVRSAGIATSAQLNLENRGTALTGLTLR